MMMMMMINWTVVYYSSLFLCLDLSLLGLRKDEIHKRIYINSNQCGPIFEGNYLLILSLSPSLANYYSFRYVHVKMIKYWKSCRNIVITCMISWRDSKIEKKWTTLLPPLLFQKIVIINKKRSAQSPLWRKKR